jgi:ATP-binding cassette subfamily F protein uup
LDGKGSAEGFADYSQWDDWQRESGQEEKKTVEKTAASPEAAKAAKKLSYMDARDYATIEHRVADAEVVLQAKREALEDPTIVSDAPKLLQAHAELDAAQDVVDTLYARWAELEGKLK